MKVGDLVTPAWRGATPGLVAEVLDDLRDVPWARCLRLRMLTTGDSGIVVGVEREWRVVRTAEERIADRLMGAA